MAVGRKKRRKKRSVHVYARTDALMHSRTHVRARAHTHTHTHAHTYIHIHAHTAYTYTQTSLSELLLNYWAGKK